MIRIRSIKLSNVKNVANGVISFKDSPFGSSVMGIYGQKGSVSYTHLTLPTIA